MLESLRPFISRLIAPLITLALGYLAVKGVQLPADAAGHITETAVVFIVAAMQMVYGAIHKGIDKKANPGDAASAPLAAAEKVEATALDQQNVEEEAVG